MQRTANPSISVRFRYRPPVLFRLSSAVEQSAVNRLVVGSNPTAGAIKKKHFPCESAFFVSDFNLYTNQRGLSSGVAEVRDN